ncbi:hypothetical protein HZA26_00875 [Candidatus Nomurabacteria bacterium]|nr:hypothetical protein [Candidatus Nomurabacteria bacterium]
MKSKIIIDGFWGMGKTSTIGALEQRFDYIVIGEPDHLKSNNPIEDADVNDWYIKQHEKKQNVFFSSENNVAMERSIVSSIAYLHTTKDVRNIKFALKVFAEFRKRYLGDGVIFIFLYANKDKLGDIINNIKNIDVKSKFKNNSFIAEYERFYREILPSKYNVHPLFINIFNKAGKRRSVDEIINLIQKQEERGCSSNFHKAKTAH